MPVNWGEVRQEYESTDISLSELAKKHDIKYPTIKSKNQRQNWSKDASKSKDASLALDASKHKKVGPPVGSKNAAGHGAPRGNKNAIGNSGGGPRRNAKAVRHGFFRKYLPDDDETKEIYDSVGQMNTLDLLWENIQIKFTAIIRAQKIMFVRDREDVTKVLTKITDGDMSSTNEWEYQHAWDKQANFLNAQARSMSTLTSMIRQYEEMCRLGWADEEQQLRIEKLKAEVKALGAGGEGIAVQIIDDIGSGSDGTSQII